MRFQVLPKPTSGGTRRVGSRGIASFNDPERRQPSRNSLPTPFVQRFRALLAEAFGAIDEASGDRLGQCIGAYGFYDYDDEPIYVGQTTEDFATRVGRHLRGQRSDTIAYRILDPFEVASMRLWPLQAARELPRTEKAAAIDALEYSAYADAIRRSKYHAILNEKIPPVSVEVALPRSYAFSLVDEQMRPEREHPDVRIARRAETLARVAAVAHERGEVSNGLRRVIVIQAIRLADLAAARLAYAEGRKGPRPGAIDMADLVGNVLSYSGDSSDE